MDEFNKKVKRMLSDATNVAVVRLSTDPDKSAHAVPAYLQAVGFNVIPVNPNAEEVLGVKSYPTLADVPEHIDIVDVFRPADEAAGIAVAAAAVGATALWLQLGILSAEAERIATGAGLDFVQDHCLGVATATLGVTKSR